MSRELSVKRICVFGIGGVGGYFGARIAQTINEREEKNYESYFIARGAHLDAIKREGIKVISPEGTIVGRPTKATDSIEEIPDPDLILLCVKGYDLENTVKVIAPRINEKTVVIPLLNGADIYDRIRKNLNSGIVLPACVYVGTHIKGPGVIQQNGGDGRILFGKDPKHMAYTPEGVVQILSDMRINYQWNENPFAAIWSKYIFIASFGLVTVYTGMCLGEILEDETATGRVRDIMQEIYRIAKAKGIDLPPEIIDKSIDTAAKFPYDTKTSYQRDVEEKGDTNEGDLYGGTIIKEGKIFGIPTPVTFSVYAGIQEKLKGK